MQIPTVLVLGATGRIGTILRKSWSQDPIWGQNPGKVVWQTRHDFAGIGPDWCVLDPLRQPKALARAAAWLAGQKGQAVILCLAGVVPGQSRAGGAEGDLADNTALAKAAIRAGQVAGARVLLASSAAVYGNQAENQAGVLDEAAPLAPQNDYARAKVAMETRGATLGAKLGVPVTSLRIGNIAGIDAILGGWRPGFQLDQFADGGTPQRSYIGMLTLARVLGDLVLAKNLPEVLNVATPGMMEMSALLDAAGLAWTPRPAPDSAIARVCLSTRALERFTSLSDAEATASEMLRQWRLLEPVLKRDTPE
ncbi:MAG: UDP-glucose 4-epimerase [Paracoccaceae bacterium]|jgi:UDP-glucose 4-epimerase